MNKDLRAEYTQLQAKNDSELASLRSQGVAIENDILNGIRLAVLLEHLFGDMEQEKRLEYEIVLQKQFEKAFANIRSQIIRATLLQPLK